MKISGPKIRLACSVGIFLGEDKIAWGVFEKTLMGLRQKEAGEEPCARQDWPVALAKVLERVKEMVGVNATVVIGLPASQTFFATLPLGGSKTQSAETLLADHHCCTSIPPSELCADMLPVRVNGKSFAGVGASRRKDLQALSDVPRKLGFRLVRVEPAPWAIMRVCKPLKGQKIAVRLLVADRHMIAMLVSGPHPLLWRTMELPEESAEDGIVSLVRSFETYGMQHLGVPALDAVLLETPSKNERLCERLASDIGARFEAVDGPGPTAAATARGLALGGLAWDTPAPDLARPLAPPPHLMDLVPRGEIAVLGAVVICLGLWLWAAGTVVQNKAQRVEEDNDRNTVLKASTDPKLKDEKKALGAEVQAVNQFLTGRILWTEYLNQLSDRVPSNMQMVTLHGEFEMAGADKAGRKTMKGLLLDFATMVPRDLTAPPNIDQLLAAIRGAPAVVRDFPDVKLSTLRVSKALENHKHNISVGDPANFTVMCTPKGKDPPKIGAAGPSDSKVKPDGEKAVAKAE